MNAKLVSASWLYEHRNDPNLVILDASQSKNISETTNEVIPGARHFDLKNDFSDTSSPFPNTFPGANQFTASCQKLGINHSSKIVVYDNTGIYTSPRVWWMLTTAGHHDVAILDGGLPDWINHALPTESTYADTIPKGDFIAEIHWETVKRFETIETNCETHEALVIDARSKERFEGTVEEPRKGLRSGHIPHSVNLPYTHVLDNGKLRSKEELIQVFEEIVNTNKPLIFSCGSGVTACIILFASAFVLDNPKAVYDGSWTEWAQLSKV